MDWSRLVALILRNILERMSPEIRNLMCSALKDVHEKAKKTPNPVDDILTELLLEITRCTER